MNEFMTSIQSVDWILIVYVIFSAILYFVIAGLIDLDNKDSALAYIAMVAAFIPPPTMVFTYYHIWGNVYLTVDIRFIIAIVVFILALFSVKLKGLWGFALALVPILSTWLFTHINFILS